MTDSYEEMQCSHFSVRDNQYNERLLVTPPLHVNEELTIIKKKIGKEKYNIVDFGSGVGRLTIPLLQLNKHIIAVDISKSSLDKLKTIALQINKEGYLTTVNRLNKIKDATIVIGADVLHHVDISKYIPIIYTTLKAKGKIIFSEPNAWHIFWWIYILMKNIWNIEKGLNQCNYYAFKEQLQKIGFKKINIYGFGLLPPPLFNRCPLIAQINYWLGNIFPFKLFAFRFIIDAEK